jgi:hypothetical protein
MRLCGPIPVIFVVGISVRHLDLSEINPSKCVHTQIDFTYNRAIKLAPYILILFKSAKVS